MARFVEAIDLPVPVEEAFDYLSDFTRTEEWDPGVVDARRLTPLPIQLGSRFEVVVSFLGRRRPLEYRITAFDRPERIVLRGDDRTLRSLDEISFVARPGGTRVTYEAKLDLKGVARVADPLLQFAFQRIGRAAVDGLREHFADRDATLRAAALDTVGQRIAG